jgi:hypothetical protein
MQRTAASRTPELLPDSQPHHRFVWSTPLDHLEPEPLECGCEARVDGGCWLGFGCVPGVCLEDGSTEIVYELNGSPDKDRREASSSIGSANDKTGQGSHAVDVEIGPEES